MKTGAGQAAHGHAHISALTRGTFAVASTLSAERPVDASAHYWHFTAFIRNTPSPARWPLPPAPGVREWRVWEEDGWVSSGKNPLGKAAALERCPHAALAGRGLVRVQRPAGAAKLAGGHREGWDGQSKLFLHHHHHHPPPPAEPMHLL